MTKNLKYMTLIQTRLLSRSCNVPKENEIDISFEKRTKNILILKANFCPLLVNSLEDLGDRGKTIYKVSVGCASWTLV